MKVRAAVALSEDLLAALDRMPGDRSDLIETAVRDYVGRAAARQDAGRDRDLLDRYADELNEEAEDVLGYQILP